MISADLTEALLFASPVDTAIHGEYRIVQDPDDPRPVYRFDGRIRADGSTPFAPEAGRYHLYSGWFCPWAQRVVITRSLAGLEVVISLSYVDGRRDGSGWAFRKPYGPDPVNGFTLLRQAYDATEAGFDGHVSVPTLWDRSTGTVASNQFRSIGIDLATQFRELATPLIETYPPTGRTRSTRWTSGSARRSTGAPTSRPATTSRASRHAPSCWTHSRISIVGLPHSATWSATQSPRPTSGCG